MNNLKTLLSLGVIAAALAGCSGGGSVCARQAVIAADCEGADQATAEMECEASLEAARGFLGDLGVAAAEAALEQCLDCVESQPDMCNAEAACQEQCSSDDES